MRKSEKSFVFIESLKIIQDKCIPVYNKSTINKHVAIEHIVISPVWEHTRLLRDTKHAYLDTNNLKS